MQVNKDHKIPRCYVLTRGSVHRVAKKLKPRLLAAKNAGRHRSAVQADSNSKIGCSWSEAKLQFLGKLIESIKALLSKCSHNDSVVWIRIRQSSYGDV